MMPEKSTYLGFFLYNWTDIENLSVSTKFTLVELVELSSLTALVPDLLEDCIIAPSLFVLEGGRNTCGSLLVVDPAVTGWVAASGNVAGLLGSFLRSSKVDSLNKTMRYELLLVNIDKRINFLNMLIFIFSNIDFLSVDLFCVLYSNITIVYSYNLKKIPGLFNTVWTRDKHTPFWRPMSCRSQWS